MSEALAIRDEKRLAELEAVVERGLATFVEVGAALLEIRDSRLYRETHGTFEDYCRERWQLERAQAYRLIQGAEVAAVLSPIGDKPRNEAQARELAPLLDEPEQLREAWAEVVALHPEPTAADVREVVQERTAHVSHNSGNNEWYTPPRYAEAAREVMGAVDLDPASHPAANEAIKAERFFTEADNGLRQAWAGRVWMNPPYARPLIDHFCAKLAESYAQGEVTEACVLVNNATETRWFHALAEVAAAMCFPRQRVKFWHPEKESASAPLQGQAVIYLGPNPERFREAFVNFGFTVAL